MAATAEDVEAFLASYGTAKAVLEWLDALDTSAKARRLLGAGRPVAGLNCFFHFRIHDFVLDPNLQGKCGNDEMSLVKTVSGTKTRMVTYAPRRRPLEVLEFGVFRRSDAFSFSLTMFNLCQPASSSSKNLQDLAATLDRPAVPVSCADGSAVVIDLNVLLRDSCCMSDCLFMVRGLIVSTESNAKAYVKPVAEVEKLSVLESDSTRSSSDKEEKENEKKAPCRRS